MDKRLAIGILVFWLVIIGGFIAVKEYTLQTGERVVLETAPVDPRDLFRGDYVILNYEISTLSNELLDTGQVTAGDTVYVSLSEENPADAQRVSHSRPDGLYIKGTVERVMGSSFIVEYGIESYFVPEDEGKRIERKIEDTQVVVKVDDRGDAVIQHLLIDGEKVTFE